MTEQLHQFEVSNLPPEYQDRWVVERELYTRSLVEFFKASWHILEPGTPYSHNWHIDAKSEHLEAVSAGEITRLLINEPPRTTKSLLCSVAWPAWEWTHNPYRRFLCASYAQVLSVRDSVKMRRLIQSEWYQNFWGDEFYLVGDQNAKERFENNLTGYRIATAVDALGTGEGGDIQIIDDPHNVRQGESDAVREGTVTWLNETMSTRFNDLRKPIRVLIMQRIHDRDCSGALLAQGGYVHLCLPMRFERMRMFTMLPDGNINPDYVPPTPLGFEDPRTEDGELLWPERFPPAELEDLEGRLGPYATAGQLQQRPTPRGGGMVKRADLHVIDAVPDGVRLRKVRSWDYAGTDPEKQANLTDPDWTCGVLMATDDAVEIQSDGRSVSDPNIYIMDEVRFREDPGPRDDTVESTAQMDGKDVTIWIEQEPGASGKSVIFNARKWMAGWAVNPPRPEPMPATPGQKNKRSKEAGVPTGNKVQRFEAFATACHRGKVYLVRGSNPDWIPGFIHEITTFPMSAKKDRCDAVSMAYNRLTESMLSTAELMALRGYGR